ncbi:MAG: alginate O-acetyltransferase [Pseudoduganella sp.]|jgi:D-alanyl-lipoteichoic acid acyltransferase DltB (MBOAT superfamily)|nr:alginate O-acetyltransferase [Pseudoduganella sp.]
MLFNSFSFLLAFLPVTLIGYFALARRNPVWGVGWLALASLFFYGWWDVRYVPLLLASIVANYGCAQAIRRAQGRARRWWLAGAVTGNLLLLAYYKYADFFYASLTGEHAHVLQVVLPIGISFFTFTQIAFLVDTARGFVQEGRFIHYVLFVTYFPHLVAGPVLHHKEMMPQFADPRNALPRAGNFSVGGTIFLIGLAKKTLLADSLAPYAHALFNAPGEPTLLMAWGGVLAYTFQLYFDFSGYSDMAIGLSRMFGINLPLNFNSPYKSLNVVDFWRRWHMTLSRFLRDYLYIPLGGNRHGAARAKVNLMVTMVLGGLWHGASWNFVVWGGLHGLYLVIVHAWQALKARLGWQEGGRAGRLAAWALTFIAVVFAWVFFRAADLPSALSIVAGMVGQHGLSLPDAIGARLGGLRDVLSQLGVGWSLGGGAQFIETWSWVLVAALVAFCAPNTQQIMHRFDPALDHDGKVAPARLSWVPSQRHALASGLLAVLCLLALARPSEFLYFQF